ncbi:MAG: NYN domain-containing protein [Bacteroidia bacterium]|nr:NYN domain-containing protein [Bacteroidia bacterium]
MKKKVIILIDGQNLYKTIKTMGIKEKDLDWTLIFNSIIEPDDEFIRTYWFRPEKVHELFFNEAVHTTHYLKNCDESNKEELLQDKSKISTVLAAKIKTDFDDKTKWLGEFKQTFSQTDYKYSLISNAFEDIEIVRTGYLKVDPFNKAVLTEKGVDVALAVRMVEYALTGKCDKVILFSGDFDYIEALQSVKNNMKKVHVVMLHSGTPPKNISTSVELGFKADKIINIYQSELVGKYKATS